jgi:hypothetical protein
VTPATPARFTDVDGRTSRAVENRVAFIGPSRGEKMNMRFQLDGINLNNRLNVIDFGGLFSGNAIAPDRSVAARLNTSF